MFDGSKHPRCIVSSNLMPLVFTIRSHPVWDQALCIAVHWLRYAPSNVPDAPHTLSFVQFVWHHIKLRYAGFLVQDHAVYPNYAQHRRPAKGLLRVVSNQLVARSPIPGQGETSAGKWVSRYISSHLFQEYITPFRLKSSKIPKFDWLIGGQRHKATTTTSDAAG